MVPDSVSYPAKCKQPARFLLPAIFLLSFLVFVDRISFGQSTVVRQQPADIDEYERLVKYYRYYKQDSAAYLAKEAIRFSRKAGDSTGVGKMLLQQGMMDDNLGEFDKSGEKYEQALELFQSTNNKKYIASANIRLGVVDLRNGGYDKAIKRFLEALRLSEATSDKFGMMEAYYSISWAFLDQKNYPSALQYLNVADSINRQLSLSNISLNILNNYGSLYRDLGQFEKAKSYLTRGIELSTGKEYQGVNITLINNLASVYARQGMSDSAINLQKRALARSREIGNYLRELQTLSGLAKTYQEKQPSQAISYFNQAIAIAKEKGLYTQEIKYLKLIAPIYNKLGDYQKAYLAKKRETTLSDSFYFKRLSKNIASLKAEYELHKSEAKIKELALLNSQRQLELEKSALLRRIAMAGILTLLFLSGLLYYHYRQKQKTAKEISHKNEALERLVDEKEWLLKEVHHRVKNNLHTIMSLLDSQSAYLEKDALQAIQASQHRIYAMSLIHQKLYQVENLTTINLAHYLPDLLHYLKESFDADKCIHFVSSIAQIELDVAQAIPVALILNEAITNSLKYAFPGNMRGEIWIDVKTEDRQCVVVTITDNGIGLPPGWEYAQRQSLGMKLMKGLTDDIRGYLRIESRVGTNISLRFSRSGILPKSKLKAKPQLV